VDEGRQAEELIAQLWAVATGPSGTSIWRQIWENSSKELSMTQKPTETETQAKDADKPKQNTKPLNPKIAELDKRSLRKDDLRKAFARPGFNL
jgi:hypothetical protein